METILRLNDEHIDVLEDIVLPSSLLIEEVASRVVRRGNPHVPGYVLLENPLEALGSPSAVHDFHYDVMEGLSYLLQARDEVVFQHCLDGGEENFVPLYIQPFDFEDGFKERLIIPHMDTFGDIYSSLCYGPRKNIVGSHPCLYDVLGKQLPQERIYAKGDEAPVGYNKDELWAAGDVGEPSEIFTDLDYQQHPILIFTNLYADGIMHSSSVGRRADANKKAIRPLRFIGIRCIENS